MLAELSISTDHVVELSGLANGITGVAISDATVGVTVLNEAGSAVTGATWPVTLAPVVGTAGKYRGGIPDDLSLTVGQYIQVKVTANAGAGLFRTWYRSLRVVKGPFDLRRDAPL
jgi:hypothetical protein